LALARIGDGTPDKLKDDPYLSTELVGDHKTESQVDKTTVQGAAMKSRCVVAIVIVSLSALLVACSGNDEKGSRDTKPDQGVQGRPGLCANLQLLGKTLDKVQNFAPSTTLSEAQDARNDVNFSLSELSQAASEVSARQVSKALDSFTTFNAALVSMTAGNPPPPGVSPIGEAAVSLKASAAGLFEV